MSANKKQILGKAGAILLALLLWQALASFKTVSILLASPIEVLMRLGTIWKEAGFFGSVWFTFWRIALGFMLAAISGILLAVLSGRFSFVEVLLWPYMQAIKTVPVASFVVLVLLFFPSSQLSVIISFLMVLPIVYTNTLTGIKSTDPALDEMAKVYELSFMRRLLYVKLPQLRPYMLSGVQVGLGLCFKSGVAAELIGVPTGSIGEMLYEAKIYLNSPDLFCWTLVVVLLSFLFEKAVTFAFTAFCKRWERVRV